MSTLMLEVDVEPQPGATDCDDPLPEPNSEPAAADETTNETEKDTDWLVPVTLEEAPGKTDIHEGENGTEDKIPLSPLTPMSATPGYTSNKITLATVHSHKPGDSFSSSSIYLPGLPVSATVQSNVTRNRHRGPQFLIKLEHGPFTWTVAKRYGEFLSLRRDLAPLRVRIRRGRRGRGRQYGYLPHLLSLTDINPVQSARTTRQLPKVTRFMNAVLSDRQFKVNRSTFKFLGVSRLSFVEDLGSKYKEGVVTKRSGGHRRVTNCLGCTACCVCRCSVWKQRWLVLKDSYVAYIRSDYRTISGVLLFEEGMTVQSGIRDTGVQYGLKITTKTRELLLKCHSRRDLKEWTSELEIAMTGPGKIWVDVKRFGSFAPPREECVAKWFVDGEGFMSEVANALLAAKEEIYITDWMMNPHIFLKRDDPHNVEWRLDKLLLKKANEGVRVFIQLYKEIELAINLGSEYVQTVLQHRNIVVFRHPEHITTGVYLWAHHEKIIVIDQTLAFIGGIDLAFGRYDNHIHSISDHGQAPIHHVTELFKSANMALGHSGAHQFQVKDESDAPGPTFQKWVGKDYYNPFVKDFIDLDQPHEDQLDRESHPRMPWHDIASCVYGAPARDVARHFIQRYNFTRHEQSRLAPFLIPRKEFSKDEERTTQYLRDIISSPSSSNTTVQILRSVSEWSGGTETEHSILNAYRHAIDNAEHFIYVENQFFISSLTEDNVINDIGDRIRLRIARAYREKKKFRVIVVMPLLPSFEGDFDDTVANSVILKAVVHWNYKSISRGPTSLCGKLMDIDGVPHDEVSKYISVYGLRTNGELQGTPLSEIVYVHSKLLIVDDRLTIIGSANINDRSMLGVRDSEVAVMIQDNDMVESEMNGEVYEVGKFGHSLRCHVFKEHLGLLDGHPKNDVSVKDPVCDAFYEDTWKRTAARNMELYEEVFGAKNLPTDTVRNFNNLKEFKKRSGIVSSDTEKAKELLGEIQGYIVPMPLLFLEEEDLLPEFGTKEYVAPDGLVT